MKTPIKNDFKCPWCGTGFLSSYELVEHAKKHYH